VTWLSYDDTKYLALGLGAGTGFEVRILSYNTATSIITTLTGIDLSSYPKSPEWLVTGTTVYLAFGSYVDGAEVNVYLFDQNVDTLASYYVGNLPDAATCFDLNWFTGVQGRALLAAGFACDSTTYPLGVKIFGFDIIGSTSSVVQDNTVSNVVGTGIAVNDFSEGLLNNKVFGATTPYVYYYPERFDPSNEVLS